MNIRDSVVHYLHVENKNSWQTFHLISNDWSQAHAKFRKICLNYILIHRKMTMNCIQLIDKFIALATVLHENQTIWYICQAFWIAFFSSHKFQFLWITANEMKKEPP